MNNIPSSIIEKIGKNLYNEPNHPIAIVKEKVFEYLAAETKMVWVVEPVSKTVTVYRSRNNINILTANDTLTGEDVVEGFSCSVAEIFA